MKYTYFFYFVLEFLFVRKTLSVFFRLGLALLGVKKCTEGLFQQDV